MMISLFWIYEKSVMSFFPLSLKHKHMYSWCEASTKDDETHSGVSNGGVELKVKCFDILFFSFLEFVGFNWM